VQELYSFGVSMDIEEKIQRLQEKGIAWLQNPPQEVIQAACAKNPWFTEFDIRHALLQISTWLYADTLPEFLAHYPNCKVNTTRRLGLILAGNIPAAGFHDVLMLILSGVQGIVKCSHQDKVLIPAFIEAVFSQGIPFQFTDKIIAADALIASGSNLTTRYLSHAWKDIPVLLRGNRYSVAVLTGNETPEELRGLAQDVLLYNGLGCRNVSQLCVPKGYDMHGLFSVLSAYPLTALSLPYRRKVAWEQALISVDPGRQVQKGIPLVCIESEAMRPAQAGLVHLLTYTAAEEVKAMVSKHQSEIQAVCGHDYLPFGSLQSPGLDVFADNVDTMAWLGNVFNEGMV
jgi:hypothetical protein